MVKVKEDLTGKVFDRLTVICQAEDYINPKGKHSAQWLCQCSCGSDPVAEKEYFGEFAPQRHLFKEYGIDREEK